MPDTPKQSKELIDSVVSDVLAGTVGLGLLLIAADNEILYINDNMLRWVAADSDKATPKTLKDIQGNLSLKCPMFDAELDDVASKLQYFEYILNRPGLSEPADCCALAVPVPDKQARMLILTWFAHSKDSDNRRENVGSMIRSLLNQAPIGILSLDREWNCEYVNQEATFMTNMPREALSGRGWAQLFEHDEPLLQSMISDLLASGYSRKELPLLSNKHGRRVLEVDVRASLDPRGELQHAVAALIDVTDRVNRQQEVHKLANYDSTTGLYNRLALKHQLERYISIAKRLHQRVQLLFIDLDGFKTINDLYGHAVGDQVLLQVAKRLNRQVRDNDIIARFGGDEFVVVLPGEMPDAVVNSLAQKINLALRHAYLVGDASLHLSASIGIATFKGSGETETVDTEVLRDELMRQADMAMYSAKGSGKNTYARFADESSESLTLEFSISQIMPSAIKAQLIETHFQPIIAKSGRISGVESLLRWHDERYGWISPEVVIKVAQSTGYIIELQRYLLERTISAFEKILDTLGQGYENLRLSINVTSLEVLDIKHTEFIVNRIEKSRIHPNQVMLELTESTLIEDRPEVINNLEYLVEKGFTIGLDDFGTGYSSLSYLTKFPVDVVKLDKSLVNGFSSDKKKGALIEGCILLTHSLDKSVVVEGVETESDCRTLIGLNSDYIQGYYYSKALPVEALCQWVKAKES